MTTFLNVNQSVALNNNILAMNLMGNPPIYRNPSQTNGVGAAFPAVICIPDPYPYWGAAGAIANVGVIWRGPDGGQVTLSILPNANQGTGTADQTVNFNVGKWSDATPATLEEAAAALRRSLDNPGGGVSDKIREDLGKVLEAIEDELKKQLS
ncbi:hypothetical protein MMC27_008446 [Xylographa pallens]|nr:hypothetical protein [Xylographa pallens]